MDAKKITIFAWENRILDELLEEVQAAYFTRKGNRVAIYRGLKLHARHWSPANEAAREIADVD
ncbi:hypothetical protein N7460_013250 [Penicillium canescens]|uniref:Uncharacterized protein n=1 Tax=Penicillium canescens TaxID=5083 RepID=A0AAD6N206_PENCN|nr:hypothetical protein N7460_013250 [Penicillium canescens]